MLWRIINPISFGFGALLSLFLINIVVPMFVGHDGQISISITKPYLSELQDTEQQLEACQLSKIPSCAPCECKPGAWGFTLGIFGILLYATGLLFMLWSQKKYGKPKGKKKKKR